MSDKGTAAESTAAESMMAESTAEMEEIRKKEKGGKSGRTLLGRSFGRSLLFLLLTASVVIGFYAWNAHRELIRQTNAFLEEQDSLARAALNQALEDDIRMLSHYYNNYLTKEMQNYAEEHALAVEVCDEKGEVVWSCGEIPEDPIVKEEVVRAFSRELQVMTRTYTVYLDLGRAERNAYQLCYRAGIFFYDNRYVPLCVTFGALLVSCVIFAYLMCSAGRARGREDIIPGVLTRIPLDLMTVLFAAAGVIVFRTADMIDCYEIGIKEDTVRYALVAVVTLSAAIYLCDCAIRVKQGGWWRRTIVYKAIVILWKAMCRIASGLRNILQQIWNGMPMTGHFAALFFAVTAVESVILYLGYRRGARLRIFLPGMVGGIKLAPLLWIMEKGLLFLGTLWAAAMLKKLFRHSKALAEGDLSRKLDTHMLFGEFRTHGEELNRIGEGISRAVEERMKSERLKTELITNVSHDIKTPLTSVINYASLLGNAAKDLDESNLAKQKEELAEYGEVLVRQSTRIKKLLEDLVEASKAAAGSIEVEPAPCEMSVLLTQALGEYEKRFQEKDLKLIVCGDDTEGKILADGRHMWRVFDNLLGNIWKYAQEGSRVYITLEALPEKRIQVIFRNMSKYELPVTGAELKERFVRGDKARNLEGNGLGLSIAASLVELQNGTMEIVVDGDLFKVILEFPILDAGEDAADGIDPIRLDNGV